MLFLNTHIHQTRIRTHIIHTLNSYLIFEYTILAASVLSSLFQLYKIKSER